MSLDVIIEYKQPRMVNYFLDHPYSYSNLTERDKSNYHEEDGWYGNITHNLVEMADNIPTYYHVNGEIYDNHLYDVVWRPEEYDINNTTIIAEALTNGITYMITHRKELLQYNSENGWGTYNGFMKFLLNYKQACEDNPDCRITVSR